MRSRILARVSPAPRPSTTSRVGTGLGARLRPELAGVLAGFAKSPHAFIVRAMNVEPGAVAPKAETSATPAAGTTAKGNLPVLADEKQLKVTLVLDLITLLPKK